MDYAKLRRALIDHFGNAMSSGDPNALNYLANTLNGEPEDLLELAKIAGIDPHDYA